MTRSSKGRCNAFDRFGRKLSIGCLLTVLVPTLSGCTLASTENSPMPELNWNEVSMEGFSYRVPSTFQFASPEHRQILLEIADSEFSMDHLDQDDRELLEEALRFSGIEVHGSCSVIKSTEGKTFAFLRRLKHSENVQFSPGKEIVKIGESDGNPPSQPHVENDFTDYPYPFSEAVAIPKTIPINLSTIELVSKNGETASYSARPSALLLASLPPSDRLLKEKDLLVEFEIDRQTKRMTTQTMRIEKSVGVYPGIRIGKLNIKHEYGYDSDIGRHVMKGMDHMMGGRLWLLFRPHFTFRTDLQYGKCSDTLATESYLFQSMEAIREINSTTDSS